MGKLIAVFIFLAAFVAAIVLFVIGKRFVHRSSDNKYYGRFLVYLSAILLFFGGVFGVTQVGSQVSFAQEQPDKKPDLSFEETTGFNVATTYWGQLTAVRTSSTAYSKDYVKKLVEGKQSVYDRIDTTAKNKAMSEAMVAWLKFNISLECDLINPDKKIDSEYEAKGLNESLKTQSALIEELRGSGIYSKKLQPLLKQSIELAFLKLAGNSFADRLKHMDLDKDAYRKLVEQAIDLTYSYIMKVKSVVSKPDPTDFPRIQPEYGVRPDPLPKPMYGVRPDPINPPINPNAKKLVETIVDAIKGKAYFRQPMGIWTSMSSRKTLFTTSLLENRGSENAIVVFNNGMQLILKPGEIVTGWELEIAYDPARISKFGELLKMLENDETRAKAMLELIEKYPNIAREKLPDYLNKNQGAAVSKAIREILDKLPKIVYSEPLKDNLN